MSTTAISFRVPEKLWEDFKTQTDGLFLYRAPFLNYMVRRELVYLRDDLNGLRLSTKAKRHISGQLKRQSTKSVNIEVDQGTAEALRAAVIEHNMVRDAFMCRLIIFLRSTNALLKYLEIPRDSSGERAGINLEAMPTSPLGAMESVRDDPLFYVRNYVEHVWTCGVYRVPLPRSMDWAACYLEDELVLGSSAQRKQEKILNDLDAMMGFAPPKAKSMRTTRRSAK